MINICVSKEKAEIICSPDSLFTEYSFSIEQGINWFFGRGVSSFKAERSKGSNQEQIVTVIPLTTVKPFTYSMIAPVDTLAREGFWPKDLPFERLWTIPGNRKEVRDGHHRVFRADTEQTIIQQYGINRDTSIGEVAYGLSDLITGFFWLGATWVKWQGSMGVVQTLINKGFDGDELERYLTDSNPGYSVHQEVRTLL